MNKKIDLKKDAYVLFFINIIILISLMLFNAIFNNMGYLPWLVKLTLVLNVSLLLLGIVTNIILIVKNNEQNVKKNIKIFIISFLMYLLFNTAGIYFINKPYDSKYSKIAEQLSGYCTEYKCDKYETIKKGSYRIFVLKKKYYDYNNNENDIEIEVKYSYEKILKVTSTIYSENQSFSEELIADELNAFYSKINYEILGSKIKEAFNNRFSKEVSYGNSIYKVTEVYKDKQLYKLKTTIIVKFEN